MQNYQNYQIRKSVFSCCFLCFIFSLVACKKEDVAITSMATQIKSSSPTTQQEKPSIIRRGLTNSCPRLIQKRVDSTQIIRHESLNGQSCDYFIYPKLADAISVNISNRSIQANLIKPYVHDFNNGSYHVIANGRHIIRLHSQAFGMRNNRIINYTIEVQLQPNKQAR